ncbi:MAG: response regulator, partial [Bacteroidales bacterium]|nr:response regulator [Bacteroidales bacterium]
IKYILLHLFQIAIKRNKGRVVFIGFEIINDFVKIFIKYLGDKIDLESIYFIDISKKGETCENLEEMTCPELTITKLYTDYFGGNMKIESKNNDVQIEVEIPITKLGSKIYEHEPNQEKAPDLSRLTILVAEDERINFHLMKTILTKAGATVRRAVSGSEAIQIVETDDSISLVFMDLKMPGLGGVEALQIIKSIKPDLPVIACTAFTQSEDLDSIKKAKFDDFLPKPVRRKDLFAIIDKIVQS